MKPDDPAFDILAFDVDGSKALTSVEVERAVYPHMGPARHAADVEAARSALEAAYRAHGFQTAVVEIPQQSITTGVIKLNVVEADVGRLRVTGSRFHSLDVIRRAVPALAEDTLPDLKSAQAQIDDLNRQPSRQVTPLLKAGSIPGTVDVELKVDDAPPWHASVEVTNDHSPDTTDLRLTATASYDNLWQRGHTISATYAVAPQNRSDSEVFAGSYLAPLWGTPWTLLLYGYTSNSNVTTVGDTSVIGKGHAIGVRSIVQMPKAGSWSQSFSFGVDYKQFLDKLTFGTTTQQATCASNPQNCGNLVTYWPVTVVYGLQGQGNASSSQATFTLTAGLRGAGSREAAFENGRSAARANFVKVEIDAEHTQRLPLGLTARARFSGQAADGALLSSEQFSAGGLSSVRGYLQSEAVGDKGVLGTLEVRRPVSLPGGAGRLISDLAPYVFVDGAATWLTDALAGQSDETTIYSAGVGSRFRILNRITGALVVGVPLKRTRASEPGRAAAVFNLKTEY